MKIGVVGHGFVGQSLRIFELVRNVCPKAKVYQASTSELYGETKVTPQNETTPLSPANPYVAAKALAHFDAQIYRKSFGLFISTGILFNHDFVIATGKGHTIKDLCKTTFNYVGLDWKDYVIINKKWVRPTETGPLIGDEGKARRLLKWKPKTSFRQLVEMMVESDLAHLR